MAAPSEAVGVFVLLDKSFNERFSSTSRSNRAMSDSRDISADNTHASAKVGAVSVELHWALEAGGDEWRKREMAKWRGGTMDEYGLWRRGGIIAQENDAFSEKV